MQKPKIPPKVSEDFRELLSKAGFMDLLDTAGRSLREGQYYHWDDLQQREAPKGFSHEELWFAHKFTRRPLAVLVPLKSKSEEFFKFTTTNHIAEKLQFIDTRAGGSIAVSDPLVNPEDKDRYYISSLIDEAITSSQLEGAATTRLVAEEMIRAGRKPSDRSERMIFNNFHAMRRIGELRDEKLSKELLFELHRIVTDQTLEDPTAAGRLRRADEEVAVVNEIDGTVYHLPPPAGELEHRIELMCEFGNGKFPENFIHPVLRSIILHFWLGYDHPFVDGNGRTARALFYWSMLHYGYWLCEYISISEIILRGQKKYFRAFLLTETDENDLTYFILYHLDLLERALKQLHTYIRRKTREVQELEKRIRNLFAFNHRQRIFLSHALRHPNFKYTIESHRMSHDVSHQTARKDLLELKNKGLLESRKVGKVWVYTPTDSLEQKLVELPL